MANCAHLDEARLALQKSPKPILLPTPKNALSIYGPQWFAALDRKLAFEFPEIYLGIEIDAGDRADLAHEALRLGLKHLIFSGHPHAASALQDIARTLNANIRILDLSRIDP